MDIPHGTELADMQLRAGEDAGPGPGARGTVVVLGLVEVRPGHALPVEDAGHQRPR